MPRLGEHPGQAQNISAYAGQSGELRFTVPWQSVGILDRIQFFSADVPDPKALAIFGMGILLIYWTTKRRDWQCF